MHHAVVTPVPNTATRLRSAPAGASKPSATFDALSDAESAAYRAETLLKLIARLVDGVIAGELQAEVNFVIVHAQDSAREAADAARAALHAVFEERGVRAA